MSEIEGMEQGLAKLDEQITSLDGQRREAKHAENEAMAALRVIGAKLRTLRQARVELDRQKRLAENPVAPVSPEVETIIQSVTATAYADSSPPEEA